MAGLSLSEKSLGYAMAAAVALAVLAFGGTSPLWLLPVQLAIFGLGAVSIVSDRLPRIPLAGILTVCALLAIPLAQLIPLPAGLVAALSAPRGLIGGATQQAAIQSSATTATLSVYPFSTWSAWLRLCAYLLVFLLAIRNYQQTRHQPGLRQMLIGLGAFEACYGIVQYLTNTPYIFFYRRPDPMGVATGTYINRNHYAGFLEMALPFLAAALLSHSTQTGGGKIAWLKRLLLGQHSSRLLRDAVLFILVLTGLLFSLSRTGIAAALIGVLVTSTVVFRHHRGSALWLLGLIILITGAYAAWIGLAPVMERFGGLTGSMQDVDIRLAIWRDTMRLIKDSPLLGMGLGTFEWASLHYQSALLEFRYEHAHNDVLETAAELGVPMAAALWSTLVALLVLLMRKAVLLTHTSDRTLAAGCCGAMAALLLHSLFDFNLQIPANALVFAWIVGAATALLQGSSHRTDALTQDGRTIDITAVD